MLRASMTIFVLSFLLGGCAVSVTENSQLASGSNDSFRHTETTSASRAAVWHLWTTPSTWPTWEYTLKEASLEARMAEGVRGRLTPADGPSSRFRITEHVEGQRYTFETSLPLGKLRIIRYFETDSNTTTFTHEVSFRGFSAFIFSGLYGPRFREALPIVMRQLAEVAELSEQKLEHR